MDDPTPTFRPHHRLIWAMTRSFIEADNFKNRKYGEKRKQHWSVFETMMQVFSRMLRLTPLYQRGVDNAKNIVVLRRQLVFADLPAAFEGYTILHLTDLHLDFVPGIEHTICRCIRDRVFDLCVLTGDYREKIGGGFKPILAPMREIVASIHARDDILATLGNHDTYRMVDPFEAMGVRVLANETVEIARNGERIWVTGLDDPYYYYTDQSIAALEQSPEGFKIALVHAPAMFDAVADNGYRLYLCGHTHGGQICLPGGRPVILHMRYGRKYYRGLWKYNGMTGYTGQGVGTVGIPVRFNTQSEITVLELRRKPGFQGDGPVVAGL